MVQKKTHMMMLGDEFGGIAGMITLEDVIEELVGAIQDEFDRESPEVTKVAEHEYVIDAGVTTNDVERLIDQELSIRDIQSIGAFLIEQLGHFPTRGEVVAVPGAEFTIEKVDERVIETVRVKKILLVEKKEE
jgi:putative hemolysin